MKYLIFWFIVTFIIVIIGMIAFYIIDTFLIEKDDKDDT